MMGDEAAGMHKDNYVALIVVTVCLIVFLVRFVSYYTHMIRDKVSQVETRRDKARHMGENPIHDKRREGKQLRENFFLTNQKAQRQSQFGNISNNFNARHGGLSKRKTYSANAFPVVSSRQIMMPNYKTTDWTSKPVLSEERSRLNLSCKVPNDGRLSGNATTPLRLSERTQFTREELNSKSKPPVSSWQMGYPKMSQRQTFVYLFSRCKNQDLYLQRQGIDATIVPCDNRAKKQHAAATFNIGLCIDSNNIGNSNRSPAEKQRHVITDCGVCSYWGSRHTYVPRHDCTSKLKTATHTDIKLKPTVLRHSKILKPGGLSPPYVGKLSDNLKKPNATITTNAPELLPTMARCNMIQFENVITNTCVQTQLKERTAVDNKVYKNLISKRKDHSALENSLPNKSRKLYHDDKSETSRHQQTESRQSLHDSSQKENKVQDNRRKSRCDERSAIIISDDSPENTSFVPVTSNSQKNVSRENFVNKTYVGKSLTNDILTSKASGSNSVSVSTGAGNDREAEGELKIQTYVAIKQIQNSTTGVTDTNSVSNSITTADSSKSYVDQTTTPKRFSEDNMTHHSRGYKNSIPSVPASNITTSETYQLSVSTIPNTSLPSGATGISINLASSNANKLRSQTHSDVQLFVNKDQTNHPRITDVIFEFQTSSPNATQNTKSGTYTSTDISQSISDHKFDTTSRVTNQCMTEKDLRSDVSNTQSHLENAQATFEARIRNIGNNSNQMTTENMANDLNSMMPIAQPSPSHETMGAIAAPLDTINIPHTDTTVAPILRKPSHEIFTDASGIDHTEGVYFDIETTGFEIDCEIVQLSAIFKDKKFDNYIMPSIRMSRGASEITKIKVVDNVMYHDDKIVHSIPPQQAFQNFIYWLVEISATQRKLVLYAHNAKTFDVPRLLNHLDKFNLLGEFQRTVIGFVDTLPLFRALKPGLESYKQSSLAEKLLDNSTYDAHNALADVGILKALTSYINPTSEAIFKYSLKTEAAIKVARFSLQSVQRKHTLEKLVNANGISKDMVKKMADSGLNFNQLKAAHEIDRGNGISNVLSATDADGIVRVTKSKSVILKVQQYFDSLVKM